MTTALKDEIKGKIMETFAGVEYPGDDNLVYDNSGYHLECNEVKAIFRGKKWQELDLLTLRRNRDSVFFFTPEAYHFYLPSFLICILDDHDEADAITDTVLYSLTTRGKSDEEKNFVLKRLALFTKEERDVITLFIKWLKDEYADYHSKDDLDEIAGSLLR
jgi:hypothetical protein